MIRIIGIGSPFGDDAAGLVAARRLAAAPPFDTEVVEADRPGAALIELLDGADAVILIDAAHSGARPGTVHDLDLRALPQDAIGLVSSHSLGVIEAVQLAIALRRAPACGRVLAIETAPSGELRVQSLDTAPERMEPTRDERSRPLQIGSEPFTPSSRLLLAAYRGAPPPPLSIGSLSEGDEVLTLTARSGVEQAVSRARQWAERFVAWMASRVTATAP